MTADEGFRFRHLFDVRGIGRMTPVGRGDLSVSLRVTIVIIACLGVVMLMGTYAWIPYASFGAMAIVFSRSPRLPERLLSQSVGALGLFTAVLVGTLLGAVGAPIPVAIVAAALLGAAGTTLVDAVGVRPSGTLFFMFAYTVAEAQGSWQILLPALVITASASLVAIVVGSAPLLRRPEQRAALRTAVAVLPARVHSVRLLALRAGTVALAVAVAGIVGWWIAPDHYGWSMVAAVVPLAAFDVRHRIGRAWERIAGTLVGVGLAYILLELSVAPWMTVIMVAVMQFLTEVFILHSYAVATVFITPLSLLMMSFAGGVDSSQMVTERVSTTVCGALIGLVFSVLAWSVERRGTTGVA
ncbi:MAG: FUSC family protein [Mycetocola sp.]